MNALEKVLSHHHKSSIDQIPSNMSISSQSRYYAVPVVPGGKHNQQTTTECGISINIGLRDVNINNTHCFLLIC